MHVHRLEAGTMEAGRHLHLAVHALLAQDSHTRARARVHVGRCNVFFGVVRQVLEQTRVFGIGQSSESLIRASSVIAPALDLVAGGRPSLVQDRALFIQQHVGALAHDEAVARGAYCRHGSAERMQHGAQPMRRHQNGKRRSIRFAHGTNRAQLFVEQRGDRIRLHQRCDIDIHRRMRCQGHFSKRHREAAVGTVVISHQQASIGSRTNGTEERLQACRIVEVRRYIAELTIHLR